jgi:F-type H+-transporting ATPase subunit b
MDAILTNFGVTWPAFIAQVLTFALVLFILTRFAFKPIIAVLEERRKNIEQGQANAEKIKVQLAESEKKVREALDAANAQAQSLINEARASGDALAQRRQAEATEEAARIIARARETTMLEHDRVLSEVKREIGRLVIETTAKVTGKVLTDEDRSRLNEETASQLA